MAAIFIQKSDDSLYLYDGTKVVSGETYYYQVKPDSTKIWWDSEGNVVDEPTERYSGDITGHSFPGETCPRKTFLKFGTAPSSDDDYHSRAYYTSTIEGLTSYSNQTTIYIYGEMGDIK